MTGLRSLGNETPILNSWAGDGTYWLPKDGVTNYYAVTYASAFGDDPNPAVNKLAKAVKAGTGGFVTGAAAIDGLVTAYARAGNTTNGKALADQMVKFKKVPTLSGLVSFSADAAQRVRAPVPRGPHRGHDGEGRRLRHCEGRPEDLRRSGRTARSGPGPD